MHSKGTSGDSYEPANFLKRKKKKFLITCGQANNIRCEVPHCDVGGCVVTGRITITVITTSRRQECQSGTESKEQHHVGSYTHSLSDTSEHPVC